ncbi:hypothetical protein [Rhizobium leguminosarum]|uniref:hypothetical protein n=1 Tax=Rhizobium leguminosarum TaxID=384 RepID=UPI0024B3735F|nr:hypothetical protein [Rhizobium leguminosarum]WHO77459.1 hypothetical protein QMO81_000087 [Rhizobium leguminosarum]
MADPVPYTPGFDYSAFEASNPMVPKPGGQLDNDFANVALSVDQLVEAIKNVRRSDGKLKNAIVTVDSLAPDVKAILGASPDLEIIAENIDAIVAVAASVEDVNTVADNMPAILAAGGFASDAAGSADLAEKWAENPRDVPVEPGKFSAMHWAEVAEEQATSGTAGVSAFSGRVGSVSPQAGDYSAAQISRGGGSVEDALDALEAESFKFQTLSTNYTAVAADNNATHRFTAAATLTLTAAVTLGASWRYTAVADGGDVTIDPSGSEMINGSTTLVVKNGTTAEIVCSGTAFLTIFRTSSWETIRNDILTGTSSSYAVTDLGAFRKLRISGFLYSTVSAFIALRTSANNGSSYDSGASDYLSQYLTVQGTNLSGIQQVNSAFAIANLAVQPSADAALDFAIEIEKFNKPNNCSFRAIVNASNGAEFQNITTGKRAGASARNAFQIFSSAGNLSGYVLVEGVRG